MLTIIRKQTSVEYNLLQSYSVIYRDMYKPVTSKVVLEVLTALNKEHINRYVFSFFWR